MRVTNEMVVTSSVRRLSTRLSEYETAQRKLATGREIQRPSDDPSAADRSMSLRAVAKAREQEARNAEDGLSWLNSTDSQLQAAGTRLQRARELAVHGSSSIGQDARTGIADEIRAIREELVGIANSKLRGQHLFSGYRNEPAVVSDDDGTYTFRGDGDLPDEPDEIMRRVGDGERIRVNTTAAEAFFDTDGNSVFAILADLEESLRVGRTDEISAALTSIDGAQASIGSELARVGANSNWLESALARSADSLHVTRHELSEVEDADYAKAVMDLQAQDVALQSTLQAMSRALPPSLATFLR